jgi:hypothetical protein
MIRKSAQVMTGMGIAPKDQIAIFAAMGVQIGKGGRQGDVVTPEYAAAYPEGACGYCGQTGSGGHGGMCPDAPVAPVLQYPNLNWAQPVSGCAGCQPPVSWTKRSG